MTTILIQETVKDSDNLVKLEIVQLTGETFFHINGLKDRRTIDLRVPVDETRWPARQAQDLYDHYAAMFNK
ncbi:hypothetical protein EspYZU15_174 [Cronobacter phage EspYZU15]|nr:hypothetical protein EspYZU15_174 [Cronobacter phage EspYZU15]WNT48227.1 hypothetical protein SPLA5a_PHROGS00144 [Salmonella phage SPLA5a]